VGALLVSPYNMAWRSYVQARGLGMCEFCFFLVVFPDRYVSSISARFLLYGAHAICFLPLVTILDPPILCLKVSSIKDVDGLTVMRTRITGLI
jgi:hypothetical protein